MKNKLIFRVLGSLASALIIASIFIPFVSVTGYSQSLWETHSALGTIYLPIMLLVFGVIGVLVFSTGFKTELAYASAGGLLFFLIIETVPVINQNLFSTLGVGYYCLAIGTLLIIVMAFLCGLKVKQKVVTEKVVEDTKQVSMIDQIDKLYNDQTENQNLNENNELNNIIQPLPISEISQISVENNSQIENNVGNQIEDLNTESISSQNLNFSSNDVIPNSQVTTVSLDNVNSNVNVESNGVEEKFDVNANFQSEQINPISSPFNEPVIQNLESTSVINPVIAEFNNPVQNITQENVIPVTSNIQNLDNSVSSPFNEPVMQNLESTNVINPVIAEFNNPVQNITQENVIPVTSNIQNLDNSVSSPFSEPVMQNLESTNVINPVITEFNNPIPSQSSFIPNNSFTESQVNENINEVNTTEEIKPLDNDKKFDVMGEPTNNSSNLDIFG